MRKNPALDEPADAEGVKQLRRVKRKAMWKPPKALDRSCRSGRVD
jgi:hypothetical protein